MFFDSKQFAVMRGGLEGLAIQQQTILHNLANLDTPGYKARSVSFENVLKDSKNRYDLKAHIYTDDATSIRPDGNNVDADTESLKLYQNYVQQLYLYQKISGQFSNLRYVMNQSAK
ncbi:MAG: flagellar biosynthesis protein FlgB [Oscillospiraceae bacterium]|nr:flagellar biosynthesis protein FlgB [Oscillospiraceae bacterium]